MRIDFTNRVFAGWRLDAARLGVLADGLAAAVVVSLPWSTTATGILVVLWLAALLPTLDGAAVRRELSTAAGGIPVLFWLLGVAGMLWADANWAERFKALVAFHKLLAVPLLLAQFRRSGDIRWLATGFCVSCVVLLVASYVHVLLWGRLPWDMGVPGVPVKDYITQSGVFEICILGLAYVAVECWRSGRRRLALALLVLCLMFLADITYVTTSRTTLVTLPILIVLFGLVRLGGKATLILVAAIAAFTAVAWVSSPYMRLRVNSVVSEIARYRADDAATSTGLRMEFWAKSLRFVGEAPVIGHGTGTIHKRFSEVASGGEGASSIASSNPHQQILAVAIQLGLVGVLLLLALWAAHLAMFVGPGLPAWCGLVVVLQNVIGSLFNSHLFDFTQGWIYVFGVGAFGGALMHRASEESRLDMRAGMRSARAGWQDQPQRP